MIFGIIGYGRFGELWAKALSPFGEVLVYDKKTILAGHPPHIKIVTRHEVVQADVIFILVPIADFELCCLEIKDFTNPKALIVDGCSVKVHPARVMQKIFTKNQTLIATHPLFGPDSVSKSGGLKGHKIVVSFIQGDEIKSDQLMNLFKKMGLNLLKTTPEEHDKKMASSQGLVHFIGRGLAALEIHPQEIATPDFQALLNINKMVVNDTWQLFLDMHRYNPFTKRIRKKLIQKLMELDGEVDNDDH